MSKPIVLVSVEGGIAEVTIIEGDVEVIQYDWDMVDEGNEEDVEDAISEALRIPESYGPRSEILKTMYERYEDLTGSPYEER